MKLFLLLLTCAISSALACDEDSQCVPCTRDDCYFYEVEGLFKCGLPPLPHNAENVIPPNGDCPVTPATTTITPTTTPTTTTPTATTPKTVTNTDIWEITVIVLIMLFGVFGISGLGAFLYWKKKSDTTEPQLLNEAQDLN